MMTMVFVGKATLVAGLLGFSLTLSCSAKVVRLALNSKVVSLYLQPVGN